MLRHELNRFLASQYWLVFKRNLKTRFKRWPGYGSTIAMEMLMSLLLFTALGLVRQYKPPVPTDAGSLPARALPSAGVIPMLQSLCYGTPQFNSDQNGLLNLPDDSTLHDWLSNVGSFIQDNAWSNPKNGTVSERARQIQESVDQLAAIVQFLPKEDCNSSSDISKNETRFGKLFKSLQPLICPKLGEERNATSHEDFVINAAVNKSLTMWSKILGENPRILYSPSNTSVDKVMQKANWTLSLLDNLVRYADYWNTNISQSLHENSLFVRSRDFRSKIDDIDRAACSWLKFMGNVSLSFFQPFETEEAAVDFALHRARRENVTVVAIVSFLNINTTDGNLLPHTSYKIRMNSSSLPSVRRVRPPYWSPSPSNDDAYYRSGFTFIQDAIERATMEVLTGRDEIVQPGVFVRPFPWACYLADRFFFTNDFILPLSMTLSFVYTAAILVRQMVGEKESRMKEFMKIQGLKNGVTEIIWFASAFAYLTVVALSLTILLKAFGILANSNVFLIFLILLSHSCATIAYCFLVSAFFTKANNAAAFAGVVYFLTYIPALSVSILENISAEQISVAWKIVCSFMPTSAFGFICKYLNVRESEGVGLQWDNLSLSPIEHDMFSASLGWLIMFLDTFLYLLVAWYVQNVMPGTYGIAKPIYFLFQPSYWRNQKSSKIPRTSEDKRLLLDSTLSLTPTASSNSFVEIKNVTKFYNQKACRSRRIHERPAVRNFSLSLHYSQVTCLLGHNGAGKTTLISMLTGLIEASSGEIYIGGLNLQQNVDAVRSSLGYCPQDSASVLFDELNVEEHLEFYATLKNANADWRVDMEKLLNILKLSDKRTSLVGQLSGGMKRRLCVALAFIGGAKFVVLDEPTAGVDPHSRRAVWDVIEDRKHNCCILLSTHHMDEAEYLSDHIAICSAPKTLEQSTLFDEGDVLTLRNKYCPGYRLICVKSKTFDRPKVLDFMKQQLKEEANVLAESRDEITLLLPYFMAKGSNFEVASYLGAFFEVFEMKLPELGVESYGVVDSTLDEVFANIDEPSSSDATGLINEETLPAKTFKQQTTPSETVFGTHWRQLTALITKKRLLLMGGNLQALIWQILLPSIFIFIAMFMTLIVPKLFNPTELVISPAQYHNYTEPLGNFVPVANSKIAASANLAGTDGWVDADSEIIADTIWLTECGISSTCVLQNSSLTKAPFNSRPYQTVAMRDLGYLNSECSAVYRENVLLIPRQKPSSSSKPYPRCSCRNDFTGFECEDFSETAPVYRSLSGEQIVDIGDHNLTEYLLMTANKYHQHRYFALNFGFELFHVPKNYGNNSDPLLRRLTARQVEIGLHNGRGYHSMGVVVNVMNNAILRANVKQFPELGNPAAYGITVFNHPLNGSDKLERQDLEILGIHVSIAAFVVIAMSFVPASFVAIHVSEQFTMAKHMQFMAGVDAVTYWLASFVCDLISFVPSVICFLIIMAIFQDSAFMADKNLLAVLSLIILYGCSTTPMMYPISFFLKNPNSAYIVLVLGNIFVGTTCLITTYMIDVYEDEVPTLKAIGDFLKWAFLIFPPYCLGRGLMDIATNQNTNDNLVLMDQADKLKSAFELDVWQRGWKFMLCESIFFFALTILLEFIRKPTTIQLRSQSSKRHDVELRPQSLLQTIGLRKIHRLKKGENIVALENLDLDLSSGECFGLLGLNGAGKSTTFSLLSATARPTAGHAFLESSILSSHSAKPSKDTLRSIGYCPQVDPLFDDLSPRQHLHFYAAIRGPIDEAAIDNLLMSIGLMEHADKKASSLSGGTKRKLSVAIALLGNPSLLLLDEPTTGMDPGSRRFLWNYIAGLKNENRLIVVTSHSIDEIEALCSKIGILSKGKLLKKGFGSVQDVKNRFQSGYTVKLRLASSTPDKTEITDEQLAKITSTLTEISLPLRIIPRRHRSAELVSEQTMPSRFQLNLGKLFTFLDQLQALGIIEYSSVSQNNLETVFLMFSREQENEAQSLSNPATTILQDTES